MNNKEYQQEQHHSQNHTIHVKALHIQAKGPEISDGFSAMTKTTTVSLALPAPPGVSYVKMMQSGLCGSDAVYFGNGRAHDDIKNKDKLEDNKEMMMRRGLMSDNLEELLTIPNHEGWGVVSETTYNHDEKPREIVAFMLTKREGVMTMTKKRFHFNFQRLRKGQKVVVNAALRCDEHWKINQSTGFPDSCHRKKEGNHQAKQVPGHYEMPGLSFTTSSLGLPYPNHMLTPVPPTLSNWIDQKPKLRNTLLLMTEPLSCCFEAFRWAVSSDGESLNMETKNLLIIGDGPSGMLLALTALFVFPYSNIYVIGRTQAKLAVIKDINPTRIHTLSTNEENVPRRLQELLKGNKFDVAIPTFGGVGVVMESFSSLMRENATVVIWAASHVNNVEKYDNISVYCSYGGWNQAEWSAVQFWDDLAKLQPALLDTACRYPFFEVNLSKAGDVIQNWIDNDYKWYRSLEGKPTTCKIVINHMNEDIESSESSK